MLNIGDSNHITAELVDAIQRVSYEYMRPSIMFRPSIYQDGNQFCCLLGQNLQEGIAAFGDSPDEATRNFDITWCKCQEERTKW